MKFFKKIATFFLLSIFLLATIGITTYKHYCHEEGTFTSVYIPTSHGCNEKHVEEHTKTHACCSPKTIIEKDHCCQDEVKSFKVNSEYKYEQPHQIDLKFATLLPLKWLFVIVHTIFQENKLSLSPVSFDIPPHLSGGIPYLQFLQIWRL